MKKMLFSELGKDIRDLRVERTRDFRIDEYSTRGNAHIDIEDPERVERVQQHAQRIQSEMRRRVSGEHLR